MISINRSGSYQQRGSYRVFVPKPLPPDPPVHYDDELIALLSSAMGSLGKLEGLAQVIPNPNHFIQMYLRKEALLSSQIEGTQASLVDLLASEKKEPAAVPNDVREVINYIEALNYGLKRVRELPFSLRFLKEIHEILLRGVRGKDRAPGEFRSVQNWIGSPGCSIEEAEFVPPSVPDMLEALHNFERYYHEGKEPPLIKCGLLHAQFETIHPFLDGNGRIGRVLITFCLCEQEVLSRPLLYLSYYFKKRRRDYYDSLMAVRDKGDWESWLKFFLRGVINVAELGVDTAMRLISLRGTDRARVQSLTSSVNALPLYELLFERAVITVREVIDRLDVTYATAGHLIGLFEDAGILREITGYARNRVWVYNSLMKVLEEGTSPERVQ